MRNGYFAIGQFLQSACATRCIEFRDGGFYCEDEEVTGRKFIADLQKLKFGSVARDEKGRDVLRYDAVSQPEPFTAVTLGQSDVFRLWPVSGEVPV